MYLVRTFSTVPHILCGAGACTSLAEVVHAPLFARLPVLDDAGTQYAVDVFTSHNFYLTMIAYYAIICIVDAISLALWSTPVDDDEDTL